MSLPPTNSGGDARGLAFASVAVAQIVIPILAGVWLDDRYGWSPWGAVIGAVAGFVSLVVVSRKQNRNGGEPPSDK